MGDASQASSAMAVPTLSVIIPTLNAAPHLPAALASVAGTFETIVVDGGSADDSRDIAQSAGATVITTSKGRGTQLAAGARHASGDWLLFLHADTKLDPSWRREADAFMREPKNEFRAAAFRFALDVVTPEARRLEQLVTWRSRVWALPYGDQGLLISRKFYDRIGGYRPMPIMEDVDIVRRIGRKGLSMLSTAAVTSADRWLRDGWVQRSLRNLTCLGLYSIGVPPRIIIKAYGA